MIYLIDDECQFWLNETAGVLTSPHFNGNQQHYGHNLNCTWTLTVKEEFYINLEIDYFKVNTMGNCSTPGKRYWKISHVVMVITSENIEFITSGEATSDKFNISRVITITTSDIFQYKIPAII